MPNNDLISKIALLNDLSYCAPELWQDEEYIKVKIMKQPTVDVVPVMHGQWEHRSGDEWWCTICGHVVHTDGSWEHPFTLGKKYCENCGAKMDGGDEGETDND